MSSTIFRKDVSAQDRSELQQRAAYFLQLACNEERDVSPIDLGFNNTAYTQ